MMSRLVAGIGARSLDPPLGVPMMGYGARTGVAQEQHDPLFARALYLGSRSDLLLVELDLCLVTPAQARALRARIASRTSVPADRILVGCVHTHSGPDSGLMAELSGRPVPPYVDGLFAAAVEAAAQARATAASARLGIGRAEVRIGRNRRRPDGPVDTSVWVVRVDAADGRPRSILYLHGCHPTVLGHENLAYSVDWPGAATRVIEAEWPGATALFGLSAHGDVDPRTRGLLDVAVEGQSVGAGFEAMEALGRELGVAVAAAAGSIVTEADVEVGAAMDRVRLPVHGAERGDEAHAEDLSRLRSEALAALGLEPDASFRSAELYRLSHERTRHLPLDEARERLSRVRLYLRDRTAPRFAGGQRPEVEVQLFRLGDAWLLGLPAEPTVDVGLEWRRRMGGEPAAVLSIANGWLRYLPHPNNFSEPLAHQGYEVLTSTFVPDAATRLLSVGEALREALAA